MKIVPNYLGVDQSDNLEKRCEKVLLKKSNNIFKRVEGIEVSFKREGRMQVVEMLMRAPGHKPERVRAESEDMYKSVDLAAHKLTAVAKKHIKWSRSSSENRKKHHELNNPQEEVMEDTIITTMDPNTVYEIEA